MKVLLQKLKQLEQLPPHVRRWIYRVGSAVLLLLAGYGVLEGEAVPLWADLLIALAGGELAMAARNTKPVPAEPGVTK